MQRQPYLRGLIEITRLGKKLGADEMTFLGLGGIGDLVVTCTSSTQETGVDT